MEEREEAAMIEVESAPKFEESEFQKALDRIEAEQAAEEAALAQQLEELKSIDLLEAEAAPQKQPPELKPAPLPAPEPQP